MSKLRSYAIYSFEYLDIRMIFKIANAITAEVYSLKCSRFCFNFCVIRIFSGASVMKRLITFWRTQGGRNTITTPPMGHSVKMQR